MPYLLKITMLSFDMFSKNCLKRLLSAIFFQLDAAKGTSDSPSKRQKTPEKKKNNQKKVASPAAEESCTVGDTITESTDRITCGEPSSKKQENLKICSWNVAGLKAWTKKNGLDYLKKEDADIVCLQETKCAEKDLPAEVTSMKKGGKLTASDNDYHMYWCNGEKKGYSGVSLWSKIKPIDVTMGIGEEKHDNEGRLITAEFEKYFIVTCYVPNSGKKLVRLDYRREWNTALQKYLNNLKNRKHVIFCGDLNVAHNEIDIANPKSNKRNAGFTDEERDDFSNMLNDGYIDSFRHLYPEKKDMYTYWTYIGNARARNVGWRLDYFVLSRSLEENLCDSEIRNEVAGSDHCPIVLTLDL